MDGYSVADYWFQFCKDNPRKVRPVHHALIHWIYRQANLNYWAEEFQLPTDYSCAMLGIADPKVFRKTLKELIEFGAVRQTQESTGLHVARYVSIANCPMYLGEKRRGDAIYLGEKRNGTGGNNGEKRIGSTGNNGEKRIGTTRGAEKLPENDEINLGEKLPSTTPNINYKLNYYNIYNYLIIYKYLSPIFKNSKISNFGEKRIGLQLGFKSDLEKILSLKRQKNQSPSKVARKVSPLEAAFDPAPDPIPAPEGENAPEGEKPAKGDPVGNGKAYDLQVNKKGSQICQVLRAAVVEFRAANPGVYSDEMYEKFLVHWSEPNEKGVPLWYTTKTTGKSKRFQVTSRLQKWSANNYDKNSSKNGNTTHSSGSGRGYNGRALPRVSPTGEGKFNYGSGTVSTSVDDEWPDFSAAQ